MTRLTPLEQSFGLDKTLLKEQLTEYDQEAKTPLEQYDAKREYEIESALDKVVKETTSYIYSNDHSLSARACIREAELMVDALDAINPEFVLSKRQVSKIRDLYQYLEEYSTVTDEDGETSEGEILYRETLNNYRRLYKITGVAPIYKEKIENFWDISSILKKPDIHLFARLVATGDQSEPLSSLFEVYQTISYNDLLGECFRGRNIDKKTYSDIVTEGISDSVYILNNSEILSRLIALKRLTHYSLALDESVKSEVKKIYQAKFKTEILFPLSEGRFSDLYQAVQYGYADTMASITELTGVKMEYTDLANETKIAYQKALANIGDYDGDIYTLKESLKLVSMMTGVVCEFTSKEIEKALDDALLIGDDSLGSDRCLNILENTQVFSGEKISLTEAQSRAVCRAYVQDVTIMSSGLQQLVDDISKREKFLSLMQKSTKTPINFNQEDANIVFYKILDFYGQIIKQGGDYNHTFSYAIESYERILGQNAKWDQSLVQTSYIELLRTQSRKWSISDTAQKMAKYQEVTGVRPDFADPVMEKVIHEIAEYLITEQFDAGEVQLLSAITGVRIKFNSDESQRIYKKTLAKDKFWSRILDVEKEIGVAPNYQELESDIQEKYNTLMSTGDSVNYLEIQALKKLTGVEPAFTEDAVQSRYYNLLTLNIPTRQLEVEILKLEQETQISINSENLTYFFEYALDKQQADVLESVLDMIERKQLNINWGSVIGGLQYEVINNPEKAAQRYLFIKNNLSLPVAQAVFAEYLQNPWIVAVDKMMSLQALGNNEAHNPWQLELEPLVKTLCSNGVISSGNPEHASILTNFIKEFGMINAPLLCEIYFFCQQNKNINDLLSRSDIVNELDAFGIKLTRADGSPRFGKPEEIINELRKGSRQFQQELLTDNMPERILSGVGKEIFTRLKGQTQWERNNQLKDIVDSWQTQGKDVIEKNFDSSAYKEESFKVNYIERGQSTEEEVKIAEEEVAKFLSGPKALQVFLPLSESWHEFLQAESDGGLIYKLQSALENQYKNKYLELQRYLESTPEELRNWADSITDEAERAQVLKKQKALIQPVARANMEKQRANLKELLQAIYQPISWLMENQIEQLEKHNLEIEDLGKYLAMSGEDFDSLADLASDQKTKNAIINKKVEFLGKGRKQYESAYGELLARKREIIERQEGLETEPQEERLVVALMELLSHLGETKLLRKLSTAHAFNHMPDGFQEEIKQLFTVGYGPTVERVRSLNGVDRQYIGEHYLHRGQNKNHTGHAPFSPELLDQLNSIWQRQEDPKTKLRPLESMVKYIDDISSGHMQDNINSVEVTMVPAKKFLRIFSPAFGDMCATSQELSLAKGELPHLKSWVYVSNHNKPNESLRGSVFAIETRIENSEDGFPGIPALVIRANNPRENFIQNINADQFVLESLKIAINTARRLREERIEQMMKYAKENDKMYQKSDARLSQCVVFPLDKATISSTNREPVAASLFKRFSSNEKVGLVNQSETNFNGYPNWDKRGANGCVKIWEIDAQGKEHWYGDWSEK